MVDFGAGSCWLSHLLNRYGCRTISIDVSESALALGRQVFERDPRTNWSLDPLFLAYDGHTLPLDDASCDRILVFDAFHHVPNQREILAEMHRVLTVDGIVAMREPGRAHSTSPSSKAESQATGVLENDLIIEDLAALAEAVGFRTTNVIAAGMTMPYEIPARQIGRFIAALLRGSKTDPQRPLPTDPLTTDSVRRRPTKLSHLIEDVTCEDGLRLLPRPTARSKALPDDQLVPEEGVLHTGLLMVARVLLPLSPSSLLHLSDRAVARGRSWSSSRHGGCPGRWNDDRRATRTRSLVDATRVVGRVRREAGDVAFDLVDQIEGRRRVVNMPAGQGVSDDHARSVDAQMQLLPAAYTASAMFHGRPFTFTHSREPGTVDDEMYACARGEAAKCKVEVLTTPCESRVIGRGQVEAQHPEDRPQKALRLTKGQVKDQAERQRGFDGNLGVLQLPSALADAHGLPRGDRFRRQPQGDVASLDQCSVVRRPVSDAVFRFVPGMHSRLHVEIMPLRPSRWPGSRRTLISAHQRPVLRRRPHWPGCQRGC